jgi:hypothetical protein
LLFNNRICYASLSSASNKVANAGQPCCFSGFLKMRLFKLLTVLGILFAVVSPSFAQRAQPLSKHETSKDQRTPDKVPASDTSPDSNH